MTQKDSSTEKIDPTKELEQEIATLKEQLLEAEQGKLRALADLENFKRREVEARARWSQEAIIEWVKKILSPLQELLLGAEHTKDEDVKRVIAKFMEKIHEQGLKKIIPVAGEEINPDEHAVLMTAKGKPGTVVHVLEPGWKLGENVLLPAKISGAPLT